MPKLFGVNIAAILNKELAPGLLNGKMLSTTDGVRDPLDPTAGPQDAVTTVHSFKGIINTYTDNEIDNELILKEDRKVLMVALSISPAIVPVTGMRVQMEDNPGTWIIVRVTRDPASATYLCQARL